MRAELSIPNQGKSDDVICKMLDLLPFRTWKLNKLLAPCQPLREIKKENQNVHEHTVVENLGLSSHGFVALPNYRNS